MSEPVSVKQILPAVGIWSIGDLAVYIGADPLVVSDYLKAHKIPIFQFGADYHHHLFRLEDIKGVV